MLTRCIETVILFLVNCVTVAMAGTRSRRRTWTSQRGGLLSRLLGRAAAEQPPGGASVDTSVVIGDVIPSAREVLRQPQPAPREARLTPDERLKHLYVTGGTGAGKTTLLMNVMEADIAAGRGVGLIDYRGEICDRLIARLAARYPPEALADRLLLIDLRTPQTSSDPEYHAVGFSPLAQGRDPYSQTMFVMDVLRQQFGTALGVQTEELCRNVLLAMALSPERPPLTDIEIFLTSATARAALLEGVRDVGVRRFFTRFDALPDVQRGQWVSPVTNKLAMLALPSLRRLLGDRRSPSLRDFLDARPDAVVLVCLAADEIFGAAALIGTLIVSAIGAALMRSDRIGAAPFFLYLDEFQNLAGGSGEQFGVMISEGRRFGLGLTLSHQSTSQLEPKLRTLIRNVVSTQAIFSTGGVDADLLAGEIPSDEPKTILKQLLLSQKPGEAMLVRRGHPTVRIRTRHAADPHVPESAVQALRRACLRQHGRPAKEVEAELRAREELYLPGAAMPSKVSDGRSPADDAKPMPDPTRPRRRKRGTDQPGPEQYEVRDNDE